MAGLVSSGESQGWFIFFVSWVGQNKKRPRILFWINGLLRAALILILIVARSGALRALASYDVIALVANEFYFHRIPSHEARAISIGSVMGALSGGIDRPSLRKLSR